MHPVSFTTVPTGCKIACSPSDQLRAIGRLQPWFHLNLQKRRKRQWYLAIVQHKAWYACKPQHQFACNFCSLHACKGSSWATDGQWCWSCPGVPNRVNPASWWYSYCVDIFTALLWLSDRVCNNTVAIAWQLRDLCLIRRHATVSLYAPQSTSSIQLQTALKLP